jgi:hypothetical protein
MLGKNGCDFKQEVWRAEVYEIDGSCENAAMTKANLRVLKWVGTVPAIEICTACDLQFKVPMTTLKRVADAQESLRKQFAEHKGSKVAASESKKSSMPSEST